MSQEPLCKFGQGDYVREYTPEPVRASGIRLLLIVLAYASLCSVVGVVAVKAFY